MKSLKTPDPFSLQDKVAIVTGAYGLLGSQHCCALATAGARVVGADLNGVPPAAGVQGEFMGVTADVTDPDSVKALCMLTLEKWGRIDILVNDAAVNDMVERKAVDVGPIPFEQYPLELWQRSLSVNVTGTFLTCQIIGSHMASHGGGSIINIGSTYGMVAPDQSLYKTPEGIQSFFKSPAYPASKGAVLSLSRFLAAYWGRAGVRVNCLSPGGVRNGQDDWFVQNYALRTPLGRMAAPAEYNGAVVFLASDASSYITGANLVADGGWTIW